MKRVLAVLLMITLVLSMCTAFAECDHVFDDKKVTRKYLYKEVTCTEKAMYYYACSKCGKVGPFVYEYGKPLGHDWTEYTFAYSDKHSKKCLNCGNVAMAHCKKANYPVNGTDVEVCLICGHSFGADDFNLLVNSSSMVQKVARDPELRTYGLNLADEASCNAGEAFYAMTVASARLGKYQAIKAPVTVTVASPAAGSFNLVNYSANNAPVEYTFSDGNITFTIEAECVLLFVKAE